MTPSPPTPGGEALIEWVVEVNEILLTSTGAQDRRGMEWWAIYSGRPGIAARTIYLAIMPPGALLYIRCDDQEQAEFVHGALLLHGLHPKGVTIRQVGRPVRCKGCGERRPFWATARKIGPHCRPCWDRWTDLAHPGDDEPASEAS
jgi:hypothetical protein